MALRAVKVTINDAAKARAIILPTNMRVPERSVIYRAFASGEDQPAEIEDLSWWESQGVARPQLTVRVEVRVRSGYVDALLTIAAPA